MPPYSTVLRSTGFTWKRGSSLPKPFPSGLSICCWPTLNRPCREAHDLLKPVDMGPKALILDLIETILVYKLPALSRKEIQTMLGLTHRDLKQTRFY